MRIATSQFQSTMNRGLQDNQSHLAQITSQMASGDRIQLPSDDPVGNVRLSRLEREEAIVGQYRDNIAAVKIRLSTNETYLQSMTNDITQTHDLLVWASDGSNTAADLKSMVNPMTSLRDSLFYSANEKDQEGRYIFSGTATNTAPIKFDATAPMGSRYTFEGNQNEQKTVVGNGITQTTNVDVKGLEDLLNQMDTTIDQLSSPTLTVGSPSLTAALGANMDGASATLDLVAGKIADFGGAQNVLETLDGNHANVSLSNQTAILDLGQLDYGEAATELNGYNLALQSSYKAYSKISNLSLFNIL
ncbi:flagellar hook-associated protein 3 [Duganella sp. BJB488]|uniref:flagellar hook-associated protein FlgL n=1 Tax=unclassified Duganella TaxID=2636909 RepID=UPI000E34A5FF|nr:MULTISPECIES: flagellar hook-associated protein FlgL [unclassified Duganella]NVD69771.1 flagellar hook-associated protein FlgL [Duganella sp. BJB1802]RFP08768.1 flagellar hook-associated protein 3 [Duganella sp. BJB489]RFP18184.1 flagellar hook-associated protein 3 [Duganella sp. BJB488]RFP37945.1 flagellar hook-associated protein 3 [Duganella sp. BJB480]